MGRFNDASEGRSDEVVIDAPAEDSSDETRLGQEVESNLIGSESESNESSGSKVTMEDIHRQNETIIDLLEQLVDNESPETSNKGATGRAGSRNSNRVTDEKSRGSNRVTDRNDSSDDDSIGDGMNELL